MSKPAPSSGKKPVKQTNNKTKTTTSSLILPHSETKHRRDSILKQTRTSEVIIINKSEVVGNQHGYMAACI